MEHYFLKMKKNMNNKKTNNNISKSSEKKGNLLIQVDELMQKLDNEYGPLMLKELEERLMKTINDFQNDLKSILEQSFNDHRLKYENLNKMNVDDIDDKETPSFISDHNKKK